MEDKHRCPNCGEPLHRRPYLMSRNPNQELVWTAKQRWLAFYVILFLMVVAAIHFVSHLAT